MGKKRMGERWGAEDWAMKRIFQPQILPALVCMATLQKEPREVFSLISSPNFRFSKKSVKIANQTNVTDRKDASVVPTFRLKKEGNHFLDHPLRYIPPSPGSFCLFLLFLNGVLIPRLSFTLTTGRFTRELHQLPSPPPHPIPFFLFSSLRNTSLVALWNQKRYFVYIFVEICRSVWFWGGWRF